MRANRPIRLARRLRAAAISALALGIAACGDAPSGGEVAKPATPPVAQPAAKPPESPPAPPVQATPPGGGRDTAAADPCADATLAERIKSTLDTDASLGALAVDVTAAAGAVTLFGSADTEASRAKAAQVASGTPCVKSVQNRIVIVRGS